MSATHTPGPWAYIQDEDGSFDVCQQGGAALTTWSSDVCRVYQIDGTQPEAVAEANARLIAAAPELLDALDYLLTETVDQDLKHGITLSEGEECARVKALAVIAKARAA